MSEDVATDMSQHAGEAQPTEKMVPQSEVDRLVGAVKAKERQQGTPVPPNDATITGRVNGWDAAYKRLMKMR